ncbi:MAG TPA: FlgD immunoglobulin-like domain containing protein [bacterium]
MERRKFLKILLAGGAGAMLNYKKALAGNLPVLFPDARALPPVQINTFSSEIVMNSRRSYHGSYSGSLSDQILGNILWAASKAPMVGSNRIIYAARSDNVYRYDEVAHDIIVHLSGNHKSEAATAFEVGVASDLAEDAGAALHFGHLASVAFWTSTSSQPSGCPKESATTYANSNWSPAYTVQMVNCYGLMGTVSGITNSLVAISSDGSLPDPSTDGTVLLENGLSGLIYGSDFDSTELTLNELSQLAWASYGNNPHMTTNNRAGLVAASAVANFYLTGHIYIVRSEGVERYHIRLPSGGVTTRDHRIERVTTGDRRSNLRAAVARIPQSAPDYYVFCATTASRWQLIEAGYAGAGALLQAASLSLQGHFTCNFNSSERTAIISALGIPAADLPLLVFSAGHQLVGIKEHEQGKAGTKIRVQPNPFSHTARITYELTLPSAVTVAIYDGAGKCLRKYANNRQKAGQHAVIWDGTDQKERAVAPGNYYVVVRTRKGEYRHKIVKS